jgi:xylulokinase
MFLGIDLGTSSVKIVLIDDAQSIISTVSQSLQISRPQPMWSEQDPRDWWQATESAMFALKKHHSAELKQVRAIGLSGQMHGATLLDRQNQPLRDAILWNDGRAETQCRMLRLRAPTALEITGNLIMPGFTAPKLLWVAEHEPQIFSQVHRVLLPKDYLRLKMTGVAATDLSDASGTAWLDVGARRWSALMLQATGLNESHMPQLFEGPEVTATVLPEIAKNWGIPDNTPVVAGGGDNAASALSIGATEPGQAFLSLGTSGVYFVADNQFRPNPEETLHTFCHCLPQRWHQMSVHLSAASCLDWVGEILGQKNTGELIDLARQHDPETTPVFLPYLSGERTPHNDPYARAAWVGMTANSRKFELVQAVLEGVAFAFAQGQQVIKNAGVDINTVSVIGGGARSAYWGEILATVLQRPLVYRQQAAIGAAYGAARLAWFSQHGGDFATAFPSPPIEHIIYPNTNGYKHLQKRQQLFAQLYQQLKPVFLDIAHEV